MNKAIVATQKKCFIIPGNYDITLQGTPVAPYSLHEKSQVIDGVKFAGYGSAPIFTPGIPEELTVTFEESGTGSALVSKPMDFMRHEHADVFVLHNPPYGTLDKLPRYGHCGSQGLRQAVDDVQPRLVLSGHVHESFGLLKLGQSYFLNPSNFGAVESMEGKQPGGYFSTFQLQADESGQKFLRDVTWKRLVGGSIVDRDLNHPIFQVIDQLSNDLGFDLRYDHKGSLMGHENTLTVGTGFMWGGTNDNQETS
mgnify:CR=1 FL=1